MNGRSFLDTNLFVYSFDKQAAVKSRRAVQLIGEAVASRKGVVSYQVVQEFFNVAFKRFARPMTPTEAEQYLATVFRPLLAVHSSQALIAEALRVTGRYGLAWYDSLIVAAALQAQCSTLYSEDLQHGLQIGPMRIANPFERS
ncbi:MAG: PIN domain-containing protein [Acidobacteria bacterium]|nr:PIN domain-containing protein [Acidobacteriota bacterium]